VKETISRIEFDGKTIKVFKQREIEYQDRPDDHMTESLKQFLKEHNLILLYDEWEGYGIAYSTQLKAWVRIDIKERLVQKPIDNPIGYIKNIVRGKVVPETEWSPECANIPVILKGQAKRIF